MKAFVTGGTGFIGGHLVENLMSLGFDITCLIRSEVKGKILQEQGVNVVYGDLSNKQFLERVLNDMDVVFHVAGVLGCCDTPKRIFYETHVTGTNNLVEAAVKENVSRFIHLSSAGVLGPIKNPPADETWPYNPSNIYEKTKMLGEKTVLKKMDQIDITVLRPEFVYGPYDTHVLGLFCLIQNGLFPILGNGKSLLHPTYIGDIMHAIKLVLEKERSRGEIYIIAGERFISVLELSNLIANILRVPPPRLHIPVRASRVGAFFLEPVAKIFGFEPPLTKSRILFFTQNRAFKTSKAKNELGYEPIPLVEGLKRTVEDYRKNDLL